MTPDQLALRAAKGTSMPRVAPSMRLRRQVCEGGRNGIRTYGHELSRHALGISSRDAVDRIESRSLSAYRAAAGAREGTHMGATPPDACRCELPHSPRAT
jgi:hypothetical protein